MHNHNSQNWYREFNAHTHKHPIHTNQHTLHTPKRMHVWLCITLSVMHHYSGYRHIYTEKIAATNFQFDYNRFTVFHVRDVCVCVWFSQKNLLHVWMHFSVVDKYKMGYRYNQLLCISTIGKYTKQIFHWKSHSYLCFNIICIEIKMH